MVFNLYTNWLSALTVTFKKKKRKKKKNCPLFIFPTNQIAAVDAAAVDGFLELLYDCGDELIIPCGKIVVVLKC